MTELQVSLDAAVAALAGLIVGRFPRRRPDPRVLPNEGAADDAGVVAVASAGAPDDSVEDMSMLLVESACQKERRRGLFMPAGAR